MSTYLDASFVVSLYTPDINHRTAVKLAQTAQRPLWVSSLCELEAANAFRLRVFRKQVTLQEAQRSIQYFNLDLNVNILKRMSLPEPAFVRAHQISAQHGTQLGIRGADLLHVAAALELGTNSFFSFDRQQRKLAEAIGLNLNPLP